AASLTLAVGIAANTAIFSIVNAVLWRPLPYRDAGRLVELWEINPERGWTEAECAPANVVDWQRSNRSFDALAAYAGAGRNPMLRDVALTGVGEPETLKAESVTANFFAVLGVEARLGRTFVAEDELSGHDDVVVLSPGFWRVRFAGDASTVG